MSSPFSWLDPQGQSPFSWLDTPQATAAPRDVATRIAEASATSVPEIPFAARHPYISAFLLRPILAAGQGIKTAILDWNDQMVRAGTAAGEISVPLNIEMTGQTPTSELQPTGQPTDMTRPIRTPEYYETYGEFNVRRADEGDPEAQHIVNQSLEGAAFLGSFLGPGLLKTLHFRLPTSVVGRAASYLTSEALGGALYGGIRPIGEDETRLGAVTGDAAVFALAGGALGLAGMGIKRVFETLPAVVRSRARDAVREKLLFIDGQLRETGSSLESLPIQQQESIAASAYREAYEGVTGKRLVIPRSTLDEPIQLATGDISVFPEVPFRRTPRELRALELQQSRPVPVGRVEPVLPPAGFESGAGTPERAVRIVYHGSTSTLEGGVPKVAMSEFGPAAFVTASPDFASAFSSGISDVVAERAIGGHANVSPFRLAKNARLLNINEPAPSPELLAALLNDYAETAAANGMGEGLVKAAVSNITKKMKAGEPIVASFDDGMIERVARAFDYDGIELRQHLGTEDTVDAITRTRLGTGPYKTYALFNPETSLVPLYSRSEQAAHDIASSFEPQLVTPAMPPPGTGKYGITGFQPTDLTADVQGAASHIQQLALMDAAVKDAVARIEPLELASPVIMNEGKTLKQAGLRIALRSGKTTSFADILSRIEPHEQVMAAGQALGPTTRPAVDALAIASKLTDDELQTLADEVKAINEAPAGRDLLQELKNRVASGERAQTGDSGILFTRGISVEPDAQLISRAEYDSQITPVKVVRSPKGSAWVIEGWSGGVRRYGSFQDRSEAERIARGLNERAANLDHIQGQGQLFDEHGNLPLVSAKDSKLGFITSEGEFISLTEARAKLAVGEAQMPGQALHDLQGRPIPGTDVSDRVAELNAARALGKAPQGGGGIQSYVERAIEYVVDNEGHPQGQGPALLNVARQLATEVGPGQLDRVKTALQLIAALEPKGQFEKQVTVANKLLNMLGGEAGFIAPRLLLALTGAGFEAAGIGSEDPGRKRAFLAIGSLLLLSAAHKRLGEFGRQWGKTLIKQFDPSMLMANDAKEVFERWTGTRFGVRAQAVQARRILEETFGTSQERSAASYALEELNPAAGQYPLAWHTMSPNQQQALLALKQVDLANRTVMQQTGVLDRFVDNYVRHLLPPTSYERWKQTGFAPISTGGGFTKQRRLETLKDLEAWALKEQVPGPITDITVLHPFHLNEVGDAVANANLKQQLQRLAIVQDIRKGVAIPAGNRAIRVLGMADQHAPDAVAAALENISTRHLSDNQFINALDTVKSTMTRAIMFWFYEHGLNVMRGRLLLHATDGGISEAWAAIRANDPGIIEAARHGLNIAERPDYGVVAAGQFNKVLTTLGNVPGLGAVIRAGGRLADKNDKLLWDRIVPSFQYFAYANRMHDWAETTGGKFAIGSPQYVRAAREAAAFANTMAGKIPTELANPRFMQFMRLVMFAPKWTASRIAISTKAAGELGALASGELKAGQMAYLPVKLRQLALGVAFTWLGSRLLSGKDPQFNPQSSKFYMRLGTRTRGGRDFGVDLLGWWQDDLKLFGDPGNYFEDRLNPMLRLGAQVITGRDFAGRAMTGPQAIVSGLRSLGPLPATGQLIAGGLQGGMNKADVLRLAMRSLGVGAAATLPSQLDAFMGEYSKRLLRTAHIPANDDNVFELSRLLRANFAGGKPLIDERIINYLAYRRRSSAAADPIGTKLDQLWESAGKVLTEW